MRPFVNKYPNGEMECFYGSSSIKLYPDNHIVFKHWGSEGEADYCFDLLSEVGEYWLPEIELLLEAFEIKLEKSDILSEYCDVWTFHNITPYKEIK